MRAIETCPLQWSLSRAGYPEIWNKNGYPGPAFLGSVGGQVVHQALERIVKALGMEQSVPSEVKIITVIRALGGYTRILDQESQRVATAFSTNPRVAMKDRNLGDELRQRLPVMRLQLQQLLSRVSYNENVPPPKTHGASVNPSIATAVRYGFNAEVTLRDQRGLWKGTADLIRVEKRGVEIIDFKTGEPKDEHALQLILYALVFLEDLERNPSRLPVCKLTIVYADKEVNIELPSADDFVSLALELNARAAHAQSEVSVVPAAARPSLDACGFCAVRQLCPTYWTTRGQGLVGLSTINEGLVDAELRLHEKYSHAGWRASVVTCGALKAGTQVLVRCPRENELLLAVMEKLSNGRFLSVQLIRPSEGSTDLSALHLTRASEVFSIE